MSDFGKRLDESLKQVADFAEGKAKPGTYRITQYDDDGKPHVIADFSEEVLARMDDEIAAERRAEEQETDRKRRAEAQTG